jgi:hypothetical protein
MSSSTDYGSGAGSTGPRAQSWWVNEKQQPWAYEKPHPWVTTKQISSMSSSSSLSKASFGWKPIRRRGEPRTVAPPFWWSPKSWFKHEYLSWRFYVWIYAALAGIVVLVHLIALVAVAGTHPFDDNGRSTVTQGDCSRILKTSRYAHWFFSVFGTGYLSASAYVMVSVSCYFRSLKAHMLAVLFDRTDETRDREGTREEQVARHRRPEHEERVRSLTQESDLFLAIRTNLSSCSILVR